MSLASFAVVLLAAAFTGLIVWVLLPANKARLERHASIPLDNSDEAQR